MVRRTSKKDKKITLIDVKESNILKGFFKERNRQWQRYMRKTRANAQLGELFLPIIKDFPAKIDDDEKCVICNSNLYKIFPKDFPDDWKFCCSCLKWARAIIEGKNYTHFDYIKSSPNLLKIYNKITLVKGNGE